MKPQDNLGQNGKDIFNFNLILYKLFRARCSLFVLRWPSNENCDVSVSKLAPLCTQRIEQLSVKFVDVRLQLWCTQVPAMSHSKLRAESRGRQLQRVASSARRRPSSFHWRSVGGRKRGPEWNVIDGRSKMSLLSTNNAAAACLRIQRTTASSHPVSQHQLAADRRPLADYSPSKLRVASVDTSLRYCILDDTSSEVDWPSDLLTNYC